MRTCAASRVGLALIAVGLGGTGMIWTVVRHSSLGSLVDTAVSFLKAVLCSTGEFASNLDAELRSILIGDKIPSHELE